MTVQDSVGRLYDGRSQSRNTMRIYDPTNVEKSPFGPQVEEDDARDLIGADDESMGDVKNKPIFISHIAYQIVFNVF
jgi:hypothetical protein